MRSRMVATSVASLNSHSRKRKLRSGSGTKTFWMVLMSFSFDIAQLKRPKAGDLSKGSKARANLPETRRAKNRGPGNLATGEGRGESDISQAFSVDDICGFRMNISGNRQGENAGRVTLTTFQLSAFVRLIGRRGR
jgi:hypothetical protein